MSLRVPFAALAATLTLTACNQLMPASITNLTAASADNPLAGAPLKWSREAKNLPFEGEKACTTWPIEDHLTVTATDAQICVKGEIYDLRGAEFGSPGDSSLGLQSDGSGDSGLVAGNAASVKSSTARKIGTCTDHTQMKSVWVHAYDGCSDNKDPNGKTALTTRSTFLQVGDARWKFTAPAPAPAAPAK
jgi:hypothetical protein